MTSKTTLVEWLINNEATTKDIIKKVNARLSSPVDVLFDAEVKDQWYEEVKTELMDEVSKNLAIPNESFHTNIDDQGLQQYLEHLKGE